MVNIHHCAPGELDGLLNLSDAFDPFASDLRENAIDQAKFHSMFPCALPADLVVFNKSLVQRRKQINTFT